MAASVNKVILIGNLGRDPETRFTNSGSSVTNFSIATTEQFADKAGARQERTEWHNIIVWGKQGENCAQYLKKGRSVYIEGRISYREYEAKDGSGKRKVTEIVANRVQFLGGRGDAPMGDSDFGGGARNSRTGGRRRSAGRRCRANGRRRHPLLRQVTSLAPIASPSRRAVQSTPAASFLRPSIGNRRRHGQ